MNLSLRIPYGYGTAYKSLSETRNWLLNHHHPEYVRRICEWLSSKNGKIGVGGGWRADGTQPSKPGFAPEGKSFHQNQQYNDGFIGACAVDLVAVNGTDVHRAPLWSEVLRQGSAASRSWGLHCNIDSEPWHMQPIEIDGWQSWKNYGSLAPRLNYPLPTSPPIGETYVNWNPSPSIVSAVKDAPPVDIVVKNGANDWAMIAFLKAIQRQNGLSVTGKYDQATAEAVDRLL